MLPKNHRRTFSCLQKEVRFERNRGQDALPKNVAEPMLQVGRASRQRPSVVKHYRKSSGGTQAKV